MSTDQQKQADTSTARHAEPVTLVTSESIAAMYSGAAPKAQTTTDEPKDPPKDDPKNGDDGGKEGKNRFQQRIGELVEKRRAAESEAERVRRENEELRSKLEALSARAEPIKEEPRPKRDAFASDEDYLEAVSDWKANQKLAEREREHAEAQAKAAQTQLTKQWQAAQARAIAEIDDYKTVIEASDVQLPGHLHQAILESEVGPHMAYYFAKHPDEAKRFAAMSPTTALRQLGKLEDRLMEDDPKPEPKPTPAPEKSKAPPPVTPVKDGRALDPGPAQNFEEYRARRLAEQKR